MPCTKSFFSYTLTSSIFSIQVPSTNTQPRFSLALNKHSLVTLLSFLCLSYSLSVLLLRKVQPNCFHTILNSLSPFKICTRHSLKRQKPSVKILVQYGMSVDAQLGLIPLFRYQILQVSLYDGDVQAIYDVARWPCSIVEFSNLLEANRHRHGTTGFLPNIFLI